MLNPRCLQELSSRLWAWPVSYGSDDKKNITGLDCQVIKWQSSEYVFNNFSQKHCVCFWLLYILVHSQSLAASPATLLHYIFTHILMFQILYIYPLTRDQLMKFICVALKLRFRNSELMKMAPHEVSLMPKRVHGETFSHDCYLKLRFDLFINNSRNETSLASAVCHF